MNTEHSRQNVKFSCASCPHTQTIPVEDYPAFAEQQKACPSCGSESFSEVAY